MAKTLSDGPSAAPVVAVASEGILSPEEQAKIEKEVAAHIAACKKITDPAARFLAAVRMFAPGVRFLCELAQSYPPAALFANGILSGLDKMEQRLSEEGARANG